MPAGALTFFTRNFDDLNINDLVGSTVKLALVSAAYVPNIDETTGHQMWSEISSTEIAAGNGYAAGGAVLANDAAVAIAQGFKYSSDNVVWTASGGSIPAWRYGVLYVSGSLWGLTNPVIGYFIGDTAPADIPATTASNTLTITCPANGWFDIS
jgi:hypothetical protein